jgi:hypothetical protein
MTKTGSTVETDGAGVATGYSAMPESFADQPSGHLGSSYNGGWESYTVKALQQLRGVAPGAPLSAEMTTRLCSTGLAACPAAVGQALVATFNQLATVNSSTDVASWTADTDTSNIPASDSIRFRAVGVVGQPEMDWQNRPTFQQVVDFASHRARAGETVAAPAGNVMLPPTSSDEGSRIASLVALIVAVLAAIGFLGNRYRHRH